MGIRSKAVFRTIDALDGRADGTLRAAGFQKYLERYGAKQTGADLGLKVSENTTGAQIAPKFRETNGRAGTQWTEFSTRKSVSSQKTKPRNNSASRTKAKEKKPQQKVVAAVVETDNTAKNIPAPAGSFIKKILGIKTTT